jgi:hypothetical protein
MKLIPATTAPWGLLEDWLMPTDDRGVRVERSTVLGEGVKLSNGVRIGGGCRIGDRVRIGRSSLVSYYTNIDNDVTIGASVTIGYFATIGAGARISNGANIDNWAVISPGARVKDKPQTTETSSMPRQRPPDPPNLIDPTDSTDPPPLSNKGRDFVVALPLLILMSIVIGVVVTLSQGCEARQGDITPAPVIVSQPAAPVDTGPKQSGTGDVETTTGERITQVGGDNDSVTAWIQSMAPWVTWLLYPLVWRPLRRAKDGDA